MAKLHRLLDQVYDQFWSQVHKTDTCWIWTGNHDSGGYGMFKYGSIKCAHRFSYLLHNGVKPGRGQVVMHSCDRRNCINPEHISLGTQKDNMQDCKSKGRFLYYNRRQKKSYRL